MRDELWLQQMLDTAWDTHFSDVPQANDVRIIFGRRTKRRLGSIGLDPLQRDVSVITINGLFRLPEVPEFVVTGTIVHELTHYAHGFNSPLDQSQVHPHAGGVMRREFAERGLLSLYLDQKRWLKDYWPALIARELASKPPAKSSSKPVRVPKPFWFLGN
jgi:hypothetical protein